jgi:hypothetical protein
VGAGRLLFLLLQVATPKQVGTISYLPLFELAAFEACIYGHWETVNCHSVAALRLPVSLLVVGFRKRQLDLCKSARIFPK